MTSDIPNGAMPKKEEGGGEGEKSGGGEGEGEKKPGSSDEDKNEKERQGSYDLIDGEPNKEQSEVVSVHACTEGEWKDLWCSSTVWLLSTQI